MIWWRGKGLWALTLVALIVVSANRTLGVALGTPAGFVSAAVLVFVLREFWGEESSVYSFPVRFWPVTLLALAAVTYIKH